MYVLLCINFFYCNRDHNGNKRVYPTGVKNGLGQMPIHIAAMNKKCAQMVIQLLAHDEPTTLTTVSLLFLDIFILISFKYTFLFQVTSDGSLPLHVACQFSSDPTTLATLLYYNRSVVNYERNDGFTALHLIASRAEISDVRLGLIRLNEDIQVPSV